MFKQDALALAFASIPLALYGVSRKSQQTFDGLNSQASASAQQLEWERMLSGEYAEDNSLRGEGVPDGVPFTIEGKPSPNNFVDAQCIHMHGKREP